MRLPGFLMCLALSAGLIGAESAPQPATTPTPAATITESNAPTYGNHILANDLVTVEISELQGAIKSMGLLQNKPIRLRKWQIEAMKAQGHRPPDENPPLEVLNDFNTSGGKHNWISGIGLSGTKGPAWTVSEQSADSITLTHTNTDRQLKYSLTYTLPKDSLTLTTNLSISNSGMAEQQLKPRVFPLNGIHQDDLKQDAAYLALVYHANGEQGKMESLGLPPIAGHTPIPTAGLDYVALKSRFFGALWHPKSFLISDLNSATSTPAPSPAPGVTEGGGPAIETGGPGSVAPAAITPAGPAGNMAIQAHGFKDRNAAHQAFIDVTYYSANNSDIVLKPGHKLDIVWTLTIASMKHGDVDRLSEIEKKIEYSDGYYRFFKSLVWPLTFCLDLLLYLVVNYGLAVVVLTILIKLLLHRTTFKQQESMLKMQKLAPDLKLLQETYKNDKQKLAQKQMELWKKNGVNPLGGCLPILIQIPIFTALYLAFSHSADMRGSSFLWINDLTLPDQVIGWVVGGWTLSINPLPLIYIAVSIWMSRMQKIPENGEPQQVQMMKMMRWLPVVFGIIFYNFPSGLVLYFTVNAVLSTIEMKMVRKKLGMN